MLSVNLSSKGDARMKEAIEKKLNRVEEVLSKLIERLGPYVKFDNLGPESEATSQIVGLKEARTLLKEARNQFSLSNEKEGAEKAEAVKELSSKVSEVEQSNAHLFESSIKAQEAVSLLKARYKRAISCVNLLIDLED